MAGLKINSNKIENIPIPVKFVDEYLRDANAIYVKVYIYALRLSYAEGESFSLSRIAKDTGVLETDVINALEYWDTRGVVRFVKKDDDYFLEFNPASDNKDSSQTAASQKPVYSAREIGSAIKENAELAEMYKVAESIIGKPLSPSEVKMLYSFYDYLSLPSDVVLTIVEHCASLGKVNVRYMEKVAISWAESGINSFKAAQEHLDKMKAQNDRLNGIKKILQISGRNFTDSEMKYVNDWLDNLKATEEQIKEAYDTTIMNTSKLSYPYMNKVLISVVNGEESPAATPVRKVKSNFNNFSSGRKMTDREKALLMKQVEEFSK